MPINRFGNFGFKILTTIAVIKVPRPTIKR
jgi:hypothetical protein